MRGGGGVDCGLGRAGPRPPELQDELGSHRITLDGGFAVVYGKDLRVLASFQAPPESSPASLLPWLDEGERGAAIPLHGPLSASLLRGAAQR
jgi:two-component system nitrogen regulation sensor histidine kinase NtrY